MARAGGGATGETLLQVLQSWLDNVVYRLCFSESRKQGRQRVNQGQFRLSGQKMDIPSYLEKPGDTIEWKRVQSNGSNPEYITL